MAHENKQHAHATDKDYYIIAAVLSVITLIEVLYPIYTEGITFLAPYFMPILGVMSLGKFILVVAYFMHLKYDPKCLRQILYFSILIAILMIGAFLFLFHVVVPVLYTYP